jgi:hypothetical protein
MLFQAAHDCTAAGANEFDLSGAGQQNLESGTHARRRSGCSWRQLCNANASTGNAPQEAAWFTSARADELLHGGDIDGAMAWRRILAAVDELQRGRREGEALN